MRLMCASVTVAGASPSAIESFVRGLSCPQNADVGAPPVPTPALLLLSLVWRRKYAALTARANTMEDTFTTLGVRPATEFAIGSFALEAQGMLGWRHTFGDVTPGAIVSFAGGNAFTVEGAPIARDAAVIEAGLRANISGRAALGLTYGGQFSGRETDNGLTGTLAVSF